MARFLQLASVAGLVEASPVETQAIGTVSFLSFLSDPSRESSGPTYPDWGLEPALMVFSISLFVGSSRLPALPVCPLARLLVCLSL